MFSLFDKIHESILSRVKILLLRMEGVKIDPQVKICRRVQFKGCIKGISIGEGSAIDRNTVLLLTKGKSQNPIIELGKRVYINRNSIIDASEKIHIGNGTMIGA